MMEQGRGFSIPWDKGAAQNGNVWTPSTPDKPVMQSSNNARSDIQLGQQNWINLMDMYDHFCQNKQPRGFDLNRSEGPSYKDQNDWMMEHGRGSSVPWEKGVTLNGSIWVPSTPDKMVLQSSNNARPEMKQNQIGQHTWHNMVDVYEHLLRDQQPPRFDLNRREGPSYTEYNQQPPRFDLNRREGPSYTEYSHGGVPPAGNYSRPHQNLPPTTDLGMNGKVQISQDAAPVEAYNWFPLNSDQNNCIGVNQNVGENGSNLQNIGEVGTRQEVSSFADLMCIMNAKDSPSPNGLPYRSSVLEGKPAIPCLVSQVESNHLYAPIGAGPEQNHIFLGSNHVGCASVGVRAQRNHILHESNHVDYATVGAGFPLNHIYYGRHHGGGYNQQEIPSEYTACKTRIFTFAFSCDFPFR